MIEVVETILTYLSFMDLIFNTLCIYLFAWVNVYTRVYVSEWVQQEIFHVNILISEPICPYLCLNIFIIK